MIETTGTIKHHLLFFVTLSCISGMATQYWLPNHLSGPLHLLFLIVGFLSVGLLLKIYRFAHILFLPLFFFIGSYLAADIYTAPRHDSHIHTVITEKKEAALTATIVSITPFNGHSSKILITTNAIRFEGEKSFKPIFGKVLLQLKNTVPPELSPGDNILSRVVLKPPNSLSTPGGFNYRDHLATKDIWMTGLILSPLFIQRIEVKRTLFSKIQYFPEKLRFSISKNLDTTLDPPAQGLYKALLIGDRTAIKRNDLEQFKGAGAMHLLAISGLHMSLLGMLFYTSISWILRRSQKIIFYINPKKTAALLSIIPLVGYTLLAGANSPVLRSLIMVLVATCALLTDRVKSILSLISATALVMISFTPSSLFTPSFQLTFAAVISITLLAPSVVKIIENVQQTKCLSNLISKFLRWTISAMLISVGVTLGTAPLLLYHFNRISLIGPLANLVLEPLLCLFSLPIGFLGLLFLPFSPELSAYFFKFGSIGLTSALQSAHFFNSLPYSNFYLPSPTVPAICLYYIGLLGFIFCKRKTLTKALLFFSIFLYSIFSSIPALHPQQFQDATFSKIHFIAVGHGSSTLIQMVDGKNILIDGGSYVSPEFDIGERVIAPFLWKLGITNLDMVLITHPDSDHINGLPFIIEHFRPEKIWTNTFHVTGQTYHKLMEKTRSLKIPIALPTPSMTFIQSGTASLKEVPNPTHEFRTSNYNYSYQKVSENDGGNLYKFTHGTFTILFPGDISSGVEEKIVQKQVPIKSTILLSPHHGSRNSNSNQFLAAVSPQIMVVSTSKTLDSSKTCIILKKKCNVENIKLLLTSEVGTVSVQTDGKKFTIQQGTAR